MPVDTSGFDDLIDKLDEMKDSVNSLDGQKISFDKLFHREFMRQYTDAENINEFFERSPWKVESEGDFEGISEVELDRYVDGHSEFRTWEQMKTTAGNQWIKSELNF